MPSFVANEIEIDVAHGSGDLATRLIGDRRQMFDGSYRTTQRALKDSIDFRTTLMARADADALRRFLRGDGHNFRFAAAGDYYSGKGLPNTAVNGTPTAGGAAGKFDKRISLDDEEFVTWTPTGIDALTGDYTCWVWWLDTTWKNLLIRRSGTGASAVSYYLGGVFDSADDGTPDGTPAWDSRISVDSATGILKLKGEAAADAFADLVALPFAVPTGWIANIVAATRQFPNRPYLEVSGDLVNKTVASPLACCAVDAAFEVVPHAAALNGGRVSWRLDET